MEKKNKKELLKKSHYRLGQEITYWLWRREKGTQFKYVDSLHKGTMLYPYYTINHNGNGLGTFKNLHMRILSVEGKVQSSNSVHTIIRQKRITDRLRTIQLVDQLFFMGGL